MNEVARNFLETYAKGGEPEGGWKFAKALQQAQLDYSEASLNRLDQLLVAIRQRAKPNREAMQESLDGRNFCALIAYYLIEIVHRRTVANFEWHDRASALKVLPPGTQLPNEPSTRLLIMFPDQGVLFMPLNWVEAQVLGNGQLTSANDCISSFIQQIERDGPAVWWTGMQELGRIASWQMMMAADGGQVLPMMLSSASPKTFIRLMSGLLPGEDLQEAVNRGGHNLEQNPENAVWQVLAYDGIATLKSGRFDAVMVLLYTYGKSPLRLKIAFPYRPSKDGRAFEILDPNLVGANVDNGTISRLNGAMERGIQSVKWTFGTTWNQLRKVSPN